MQDNPYRIILGVTLICPLECTWTSVYSQVSQSKSQNQLIIVPKQFDYIWISVWLQFGKKRSRCARGIYIWLFVGNLVSGITLPAGCFAGWYTCMSIKLYMYGLITVRFSPWNFLALKTWLLPLSVQYMRSSKMVREWIWALFCTRTNTQVTHF